MAYSIKTGSVSGTGLETTARFWKNHRSVSMDDTRPKDSGIPLDVKDGKVAFSEPETHCMVSGVSGKGKTRRELYPTVILSARAGRSMVIADMKGEIYRNTAEEVRRCGHDIRVINLRDPMKGDRFSPLTLVKECWDNGDRSRATVLLKDIAEIITAKIVSDRDGYWRQSAQDSFIGFALLLLEYDQELTFENIQNLFNGCKDRRDDLLSKIGTDSESYRRLATILLLDSDITYGCVVSEFNSAIGTYTDQEDIRDLLYTSDIELTDIGRKPTAVYLMCPDESTALYGIASLFVEQCYSELIRYADEREDNRLPVKVDFILDEFGAFVGSDWPSKLTAARSRGIRFILALQSMSQLITRHGESGARTIMANCRTMVYMGGRDMKLMSEISLLSGYRDDPATGMEKPVLSINDLSALKQGEIVVLDDWGLPYIGKLPDWEEWNVRSRAFLSDTRRKPVRHDCIDMPTMIGIMREVMCGTGYGPEETDDELFKRIEREFRETEEENEPETDPFDADQNDLPF